MGIFLLYGLRGALFLMTEVPLYPPMASSLLLCKPLFAKKEVHGVALQGYLIYKNTHPLRTLP